MQSLIKSERGARALAKSARPMALSRYGSDVFESLLGRPPAYFRRKLRNYWAAHHRVILKSMLAVIFPVLAFTDVGLPLRAGVLDGLEAGALVAGLRVGQIVIEGDDSIPDADVLDAISPLEGAALPFYNANSARKRLLSIPRVRAATVLKLYPNTLHLKIVEREPFGLWQRGGELSVIDEKGRIVRDKPEQAQKELPLYVGEGANIAALDLENALNDAPDLRARVSAAVRVADRRWNLKLFNGIDVRLPEADVSRAILTLATMMKQRDFFDQPIRTIDLRLADRVTLTLTKEGAVARRIMMERRRTGGQERQT